MYEDTEHTYIVEASKAIFMVCLCEILGNIVFFTASDILYTKLYNVFAIGNFSLSIVLCPASDIT